MERKDFYALIIMTGCIAVMSLIQIFFVGWRDVDSFHYLSIIQGQDIPMQNSFDWLLYELGFWFYFPMLALLTIIICYLCYDTMKTLQIPGNIRILSAIMLIFDPFFIFNVSPRLIDKNIIYMFAFVFMIWFLVKYGYSFESSMAFFTIFIALSFFWEGYFVFILFFGIVILTGAMHEMKSWSLIGLGMLLSTGILYLWNKIPFMFEVGELRPAIFLISPMYYLYIFVILIYFLYVRPKQKMFNIVACVSLLSFVMVFRMHTMMIPVMYIIVGYAMHQLSATAYKHLIPVLFIVMMICSYPMIFPKSYDTPNIVRESIEYRDSDATCLWNDWGIGHVIQYYAYPKQVSCMGHPSWECMAYKEGNVNISECFEIRYSVIAGDEIAW